MERFLNYITLIKATNKALFGKSVFWAKIVAAFLIGYDINFFLNNSGQGELIYNVIIEVHGLFFDLLIFGWIIANYDAKKQKSEQIEREKNIIDDFRGWKDREATFRIVGAIKRLIKEGVSGSDINLSKCFLDGAHLHGTHFKRTHFENAILPHIHFEGAHLEEAHLEDTQLQYAHLERAHLEGAHLERADLLCARLDGAYLQGAHLQGAIVGEAWFQEIETMGVVGIDEIIEKYQIDEIGRLQLK